MTTDGSGAGEGDEAGGPGLVVDQIRAIAGVGPGGAEFVVRGSGCDVRVRVKLGLLTLAVSFPERTEGGGGGAYRGDQRAVVRARRPLELIVRRETEQERQDKAAGINREFQTGDAGFDREVYITSHAEESVLGSVLARAEVRDAILTILRTGPTQFTLDDTEGNVSVWYKEATKAISESTGREVLDALEALVEGLPALVTTGRGPLRWSWLEAIGAIAAVCAPGGIVAVALVCSRWSVFVDGARGAGLAGWYVASLFAAVLAGWGLGTASGAALTGRIKGQYHSATNRKLVRFTSIVLGIELCVIAAQVYWWTT